MVFIGYAQRKLAADASSLWWAACRLLFPSQLFSVSFYFIACFAGFVKRCNASRYISYNASTQEGSSVYLKEGDRISLENLLYGLMLSSGNDAAVAIAEHIAGTEDDFVKKMNEKAVELGINHISLYGYFF